MMGVLGNLVFLNPWILAGLLALPALWVLLRLMPPAPKRIFLPSAAFLKGIIAQEKTPRHTPWWILLLRLLISGLVILACAGPVLAPKDNLSGNSDRPIRVLIDNDWAAAHIWDTQIDTARDIIARAGRDGRSVLLMTSAEPLAFGPLSAGEASEILGGLLPQSWQANYRDVQALIDEQGAADTVWLSQGIYGADDIAMQGLMKGISAQGAVDVYRPSDENLPIALSFSEKGASEKRGDSFALHAPAAMPSNYKVSLQALDANGRVLGLQSVTLNGEEGLGDIELDLPDALRVDARMLRIAERSSAGSTLILGDRYYKKKIGIVTPSEGSDEKPFIDARYYLSRALEPYADIRIGAINEVISGGASVIILPDIGALAIEDLDRLEGWVRDGGLLLRFAGPNMVDAQNFLLPVPLRRGKRSLDGALSWENPPALTQDGFAENSPLYGVAVRDPITVRQQLLAQPSQDLEAKVWARLDDGTPLITADALDRGMIVMVHTSAAPNWSGLPLSGTFVSILERLVKLSGNPPEVINAPASEAGGALSALWVLDGFGRMQDAPGTIKTLDPKALSKTVRIDADHPPGLYARGGVRHTLNLGPQIKHVRAFTDDASGVTMRSYGMFYEHDLRPALLFSAMLLLLVDWFVMLLVSSQIFTQFSSKLSLLSLRSLKRSISVVLLFTLYMSSHVPPAQAQANDLRYADGLYLAYIKNADPHINTTSQAGLEALSAALKRRTSAEPDGVVTLDPSVDELGFFPLIYWPVGANDAPLYGDALRNVQHYLDHGGTVIFDLRGRDMRGGVLRDMLGGLNIPALQPIPDDHVLGRTFYLLDDFPGQISDATLWVESTSAPGRDGVSSVLIGSHDWASAWAQAAGPSSQSSAQNRRYEMSLRFGVNAVMYALTGNYKADQVHVDHILERLGE